MGSREKHFLQVGPQQTIVGLCSAAQWQREVEQWTSVAEDLSVGEARAVNEVEADPAGVPVAPVGRPEAVADPIVVMTEGAVAPGMTGATTDVVVAPVTTGATTDGGVDREVIAGTRGLAPSVGAPTVGTRRTVAVPAWCPSKDASRSRRFRPRSPAPSWTGASVSNCAP